MNQSVRVKSLSCVQLFASPWTVAGQVPPSMEFSRQEHWSGLPLPSPGDLPDTGRLNLSLPHPRQILYHLSHRETPKCEEDTQKPQVGMGYIHSSS